MNVDTVPVILGDAESATALWLRAALVNVDVRSNLSTWAGGTPVVHVYRVGGSRDRFIDRARIAIDVHHVDRDSAFATVNAIRGHLQAWPAAGGPCRESHEELGPTSLPVESELPIVTVTWVVSI